MVGEGEIARLAVRKEALVRQNEAARERLAADLSGARAIGKRLDSGFERVRRIRPIMILLAPLAGYVIVRRQGTFSELLLAAKSGLRYARIFQKATGFLRRI